MDGALFIALGFLAGIIVGFLTGYAVRGRPQPSAQSDKAKKPMETTKAIIWVCLGMGFLWVWTSYILAWQDKAQIAESLSQAAVTEIIGVVLAYCIKSGVENLSKNNTWPDKSAPTSSGIEPERKEPEDVGQ